MPLTVALMLLEFFKLSLGLSIALFHRQIADYLLEHDRVLVGLLRQKGVAMPCVTEKFARNVYFSLGIFVAAVELVRIWMLLRGY